MNTMFFQDLCKGQYGRKTAYTNVEEINSSNIVNVLGNVIGIFNKNKQLIKYLWEYKNGDQPILYRRKTIRDDIVNHVVENHAYEIVRFKNGQTYGEPIQLVAVSEDEKTTKAVEKLNNYFRVAFKHRNDIDSGEWTSAVGTGYKAVQLKHGNVRPFRLTVPNPMNTFIVYSAKTGEAMMSVQELYDDNNERYFHCFTETHEYRVKDSKVVDERLHIFGGIPIVEYPNNQERISDIELVITMLDAINNMQSNRMDAIEQFVQSFVKFVNCEVDEKTFQQMKMKGAFVVKSNNKDAKSDVEIMSQELNQTQSQVAKDDLLNNILSIEAIPNKQGNTGGDTQGAVELRNGWDFSKQAARLKDAYIKEAEIHLCEIILNVIRVEKGANDCPISIMDFDVQINHSPLDNLLVKVQSLQMLLQSGIHPLVAIKTIPLWGDAQEVYNVSKPYLDVIYKTIDQAIEEQNLQAEVEKAKAMYAGMNKESANGAVEQTK